MVIRETGSANMLDPEKITNQSKLGFQKKGLKKTGAKTECFRQRVNAGVFIWTV